MWSKEKKQPKALPLSPSKNNPPTSGDVSLQPQSTKIWSSGKRMAIVGAGSSGITAVKCCIDEGIEPVCFERETYIGGLWHYHQDTTTRGKGGVYESCVINTSKEMMAYSDFPIPEYFPPFMHHEKVVRYFEMYAENFGLHKYIKFNTVVTKIEKASDYDVTGRWVVRHRNGVTGDDKVTETFDGVMLCSGHHTVPHVPTFEGMDGFTGTKIHSLQYKTPQPFAHKRVLVIGIGNSAADIAVDISRVSNKVYLSTRHGSWVFSRVGFWGLPLDAIANSRVAFIGDYRILQGIVEKMANSRFDHRTYGLEPAHRALEAHPTVNDELPYRIMSGSIKAKRNVTNFSHHGVNFNDGTYEDIDAVIFATGYNYRYDYIDNDVINMADNQTKLYKYTFPPHHPHPTLAVIGLIQAVGAVMPIAELQSRWFTRLIKGLVKLPDRETMEADIILKRKEMAKQYVPSQRHTLEAMWVPFMDELADQIGVKPDLKKLAREDLWFAVRCFIGPCVPAQYRLMGPGAWDKAKATIDGVVTRSMAGIATRELPDDHPTLLARKKRKIHDPLYVKMGDYLLEHKLVVLGCVLLIYFTSKWLRRARSTKASSSRAGPSTGGPSTAGPSTAGPSTAGSSTAGSSTAASTASSSTDSSSTGGSSTDK